MKNMYKITMLLLFISSVSVSCKSEKEKTEEHTQKVEEVKKPKSELLDDFALKVEMDFETDTEGVYQIKFRDPNNDVKPTIKYFNIKEVNTNQTISGVYDLQKNDFPLYVQIIMGSNEKQRVKLNEIKLITDEIIIKVNKDNFKQFINTTKYLDFDANEGVFIPKKVDNVHLPIIMLSKKSLDSLSL